MSDKSLHGGREGPLCQAMAVNHEFCWRPKDVKDASTMEYLPRRAASRYEDSPRERKVLQSATLERKSHVIHALTSDSVQESLCQLDVR